MTSCVTLCGTVSQLGVIVMRSGIVGSNTHRALSVAEFRGFAVSDPLAPVVFINAADAPAAQSFTLMHELAHLWMGLSGISNSPLDSPSGLEGNDIESSCNAVAAEVLIPEQDFLLAWPKRGDLNSSMAAMTRHFRVSSLVILRRAYDLGQITEPQFRRHYQGTASQVCPP